LKKVFNRGEYLFDAYLYRTSNVINCKEQNHQGVYIGKVIKVEPFKDLFKIAIKSSHSLTCGDGLKMFSNGEEVLSLGVGNVDKIGNDTYVIYSKNKPQEEMTCNLILDSANEKAALSRVKSVPISISYHAMEGEKFTLKGVSKNTEITYISDFSCPKAEKEETKTGEIAEQLNKAKDSGFEIFIDYAGSDKDKVFIPKSVINNARRNLLFNMKKALIELSVKDNNTLICVEEISHYKKIAHYSENKTCLINYDYNKNNESDNSVFVISPSDYSDVSVKAEILKIKNQNKRVALELPIIANHKDISVLEKLIESVCDNVDYLIVNNLYGYGFSKYNIPLIAGYGMNVYNDYAAAVNEKIGGKIIIKSIETDENIKISTVEGVLTNFKIPLMTFANCFNQSLNGASCSNCKDNKFTIYKDNQGYNLERYKINDCYYRLYELT